MGRVGENENVRTRIFMTNLIICHLTLVAKINPLTHNLINLICYEEGKREEKKK